MNTQDFFYISLGLGVWLITLIITIVAFQLSRTLLAIRRAAETAADISRGIRLIKNSASFGFFSLMHSVLTKLTKGGEMYEQRYKR